MIVELIENDQRQPTEFFRYRRCNGIDGIRCGRHLECQHHTRPFIERGPQASGEKAPRVPLPIGPSQALHVNRQQLRTVLEARDEAGLKQGGFARARVALKKHQRVLVAQPDELCYIVGSADQMRGVGTFETQRFRTQQHRAASARQAKKPKAEGDKGYGREAELPLVEAGVDPDGFSNRIGKTVDRRKQPADYARCQQDGSREAGFVLVHWLRLDGAPL